jgi:hypothetical protein
METSMEHKGRMSRTILNFSCFALDLSLVFYLYFPTSALGILQSRRPLLSSAAQPVQMTDATKLRSVQIEDFVVFPVVQQPGRTPNYVSKKAGEVTQFASASDYGNIGLLAHNFLSGKSFFQLHTGQEVLIEYSDGTTEVFVVTEILRYQAIEPKSPFSSFRNLSNTDEVLSTQQMFERAYAGGRHITFQTCIAKYGNASWGRLFVVATPKQESFSLVP